MANAKRGKHVKGLEYQHKDGGDPNARPHCFVAELVLPLYKGPPVLRHEHPRAGIQNGDGGAA